MIKINKFSNIKVTAVMLMLIGFVGAAVYGQAQDFKPIADEMFGSNSITWSPKMNYAKLVLTISRPDGTVFGKTFDSGITPYADLSGILGESASDGSYTYELRLIPVTERRYRGAGSNDSSFLSGTRASGNLTGKALTQTGAFLVQGGMIVNNDVLEPGSRSSGVSNTTGTVVYSGGSSQDGISFPQDQVIADDLIVQGSACVGVDCVNNENFGFDTIRLKENNLRIKFQDTSNSGSFPSNDWQLTANDSTNGGANRFSIEDIDGGKTPFTIEAGAPNNSLYVDDGGRVGLGTSTPVVEAHIVDGDTPTLRLEQDASSGFTAQTWDVAGNEANFFVRDVTHSSHLIFRIKPGAPENSLFVAGDGDIGIGTETPADGFSMEIKRTSGNTGILLNNNETVKFKLNVTSAQVQIGSQTDTKVNFVQNNAAKMTLDTTGFLGLGTTTPGYPIEVATANNARLEVTGNWVNPSSRELKENIKSLSADEAIKTLTELNPVKYNYKVDKTEGYVGFIAEDVPELVAVKDRKGLVTMDVVAVLTRVVQEQQKTISELKEKIAGLEKK